MGSKRKSANKIYSTIHKLNPNSKLLIDLFCGGFAISEKFMCKGWNVIANDKNKYVIALLRKVLFEGLPEEIITNFVTREMFFDISEKPNNYEPWYIGYVQCVWSFGNNQRDYIFGKNIESIKYAGHELVVNCDPTKMKDLISNDAINKILSKPDRISRRMELMSCINERKFELERLQQLEQLERLQRLQQLEQLERLQQLEQLERLERLQLYSLNYNEVSISSDAIVYCDPPYFSTAEYKEDSFNHIEFWEYCRNISKTNKIYISEYNAPNDFIPVLKFEQKSTLQGGTQKHKNQPMECLFAPKGQDNYEFIHFKQQSLF
jgi:site-specific DNA-adenine methylase